MIEVEGTVERITYHNQENGFTVVKLSEKTRMILLQQ